MADTNPTRPVLLTPDMAMGILNYFSSLPQTPPSAPPVPAGLPGAPPLSAPTPGSVSVAPPSSILDRFINPGPQSLPPGAVDRMLQEPIPDVTRMKPVQVTPGPKDCPPFQAQFTSVSQDQAPAGALKDKPPPTGSVAINPKIFGLPYDTLKERGATQNLLNTPEGRGIVISVPGLTQNLKGGGYLGDGSTDFPVRDVGDKKLRDNPVPQFDIYRWDNKADADKFGRRNTTATAQNVPYWMLCPK